MVLVSYVTYPEILRLALYSCTSCWSGHSFTLQLFMLYVRSATNTLSLRCARLITPRVEAQHDADRQLHHRLGV